MNMYMWESLNAQNKVLGEMTEGTDRHNREIIYAKGKFEDYAHLIDVVTPEKFDFVISQKTYDFLEHKKRSKNNGLVRKAIDKTKEQARTNFFSSTIETLYTFDEIDQKYNKNITTDEKIAWLIYCLNNKIYNIEAVKLNGWSKYLKQIKPTTELELIKKGLGAYDMMKGFLPNSIFYTGNMYDRKYKYIANKNSIIAASGMSENDYNRILERIKNTIPTPKKITKNYEESIHFSLRDLQFVTLEVSEGKTVGKKFVEFLSIVPKSKFRHGSNKTEIVDIQMKGKSGATKEDSTRLKNLKKTRSSQDAKELLHIFLNTMSNIDKKIVESFYNKTMNAYVNIDFSKIPIGFTFNKKFKTGALEMREEQREGVAFMSAAGSGLIAYDVGLGKTMTAIMSVANSLQNGQCIRPLIVVPKPTYKKWIEEIEGVKNRKGEFIKHGILPNYKINKLGNLGSNVPFNEDDIDDFSISICTFEGFSNFGLDKYQYELTAERIMHTIFQTVDDRSSRQAQIDKEKAYKTLGNVFFNSDYSFIEARFDYIVLDEAHNFKNLLRGGKISGLGGTPATRAIHNFVICDYVRQQNNGRNLCFLTATPFSNSILEIYSMLAVLGYETMVSMGISKVSSFVSKFAGIVHEEVITVNQEISTKEVIKSFINLESLQLFLYKFIIYKTGEESSGIIRPTKMVMPYKKDKNGQRLTVEDQVSSICEATPRQKYLLNQVRLLANGKRNALYTPDSLKDAANQSLRAIGMAKAITISPYLLRTPSSVEEAEINFQEQFKAKEITKIEYEKKGFYEGVPDDAEDFIKSSPKLEYVCGCIKTVVEHHRKNGSEISGQVIYMEQGKVYFPLIKKYLMESVGFTDDEVRIIAGGVSTDKKEKYKEGFLKGKVKVIIGSSTIKEGIDLQNKATCLYLVTPTWTPTALRQVEGRIWRHGNQYSHVRIVNVLLIGSMDMFLYQKIEEKTARLNTIWKKEGRKNVFNLDDLDPREEKLALISDPVELAKNDIEQRLNKQDQLIEGVLSDYNELLRLQEDFNYWETLKADAERWQEEAQEEIPSKINSYQSQIEEMDSVRVEVRKIKLQLEKLKQKKDALNTKRKNLWNKKDKTDDDKRIYKIVKEVEIPEIETQINGLNESIRNKEATYKHSNKSFNKIYDEYVALKNNLEQVLREDDIDKTTRNLFILERGAVRRDDRDRYKIYVEYREKIKWVEEEVLGQYDKKYGEDLTDVMDDMSSTIDHLREQKEIIESEQFLASKIEEYAIKIKETNSGSRPIPELIKQFAGYNYLLDCFAKTHDCNLEDKFAKKLNVIYEDNNLLEAPKQNNTIELPAPKQAQKETEKLTGFVDIKPIDYNEIGVVINSKSSEKDDLEFIRREAEARKRRIRILKIKKRLKTA